MLITRLPALPVTALGALLLASSAPVGAAPLAQVVTGASAWLDAQRGENGWEDTDMQSRILREVIRHALIRSVGDALLVGRVLDPITPRKGEAAAGLARRIEARVQSLPGAEAAAFERLVARALVQRRSAADRAEEAILKASMVVPVFSPAEGAGPARGPEAAPAEAPRRAASGTADARWGAPPPTPFTAGEPTAATEARRIDGMAESIVELLRSAPPAPRPNVPAPAEVVAPAPRPNVPPPVNVGATAPAWGPPAAAGVVPAEIGYQGSRPGPAPYWEDSPPPAPELFDSGTDPIRVAPEGPGLSLDQVADRLLAGAPVRRP